MILAGKLLEPLEEFYSGEKRQKKCTTTKARGRGRKRKRSNQDFALKAAKMTRFRDANEKMAKVENLKRHHRGVAVVHRSRLLIKLPLWLLLLAATLAEQPKGKSYQGLSKSLELARSTIKQTRQAAQ